MSAPTEKERALANLRHLYTQMVFGTVSNTDQAKRIAEGLLSPAIALLERAPAVQVPRFNHAAKRKLEMLIESGESITGYAFQNKDGRRGSIDCHGFVAWWNDSSAGQQDPAAAVEAAAYREKWDAELGRTAMRFVDRAGDVHPGIDDADQICREFHEAMSAVINQMPHVQMMRAAAPQPPEADHIPDAGKMDTNVRNLMNAALVACPDCGLSGLHACPSASTAESQGADAVKALEKVLRAVQRHLPPERIGERETIAEIISIVDPWPLGKPPVPWKDHMTAELVGKLTDVARQFHGAQQLRERIAGLVRPLCERIKQLGDDRMPEGDMGNPISASAPAQLPEIDIDTANHAGIRVRGYTQETVCQLLADQQFKLDELAMLTRMVVHAFRQVAPDNKTAAKAVDYLKRKGLQGNPLRSLGIQEQRT